MYYFDFLKFKDDMESAKTFDNQYDYEKYCYDFLVFLSAVQGLANAQRPQLFIRFLAKPDSFWLNRFLGKDGFLSNETIDEIDSFEGILEKFSDYIKGFVLWDEKVPATANVAATICGVESLIPVRFLDQKNSFYRQIKKTRIMVRKSLFNVFTGKGIIFGTSIISTGSKKCDCYLWAKERYLDSGYCNDSLMAYMLDGMMWGDDKSCYPDLDNTLVANHDYYIARKAFFFDLSPWDDETPNDDKEQQIGTDYRTFQAILESQYNQNQGKKITTIGGFTPWQVKYVSETVPHCHHGGVETEWRHAELLSAYNAILDADAPSLCGMSNASVYMHHPLKEKYTQNKDEYDIKLQKKTYLMYYMGDYDSAAWLSREIPEIWNDPDRGKLPLAWPFNSNLSDRAPHVFDYVYSTKTNNDFFVAGDSGAGYLNPLYLLEPRKHSDLPSGMDLWIRYNQAYYEKFDLNITGFIINGHLPINEEVQKAYAQFSPGGVGLQNDRSKVDMIKYDTVFYPQSADIGVQNNSIQGAFDIISSATADKKNKPQFHIFRSVLCTPTFIYELTEKLQKTYPEREFCVLPPQLFFKLLKQNLN